MKNRLDVVRVQVVRDGSIKWEHEPRFTSPAQIVGAARAFLQDTDREQFLAFLLDGKNRISSVHCISIGSLNQSIVHPREAFKAAILASASALVLVHNHPSGDPAPSREDIEVTKRLVEAGGLLGIRILDHIIVGDGSEAYYSFVEGGLI